MCDKKCRTCGVVKPLTEFHKCKSSPDGHVVKCKACCKAYQSKYFVKTKEKRKEYAAQYYKENQEAIQSRTEQYARDNREKAKSYKAKWKKENRGAVNAIGAKRRAQKLQATPAWADLEAIKSLYEEAQRLQELTGIDFHIDHVVPLQGELVCGLHVEYNLQVIPAALNLRKSNKFKVQ